MSDEPRATGGGAGGGAGAGEGEGGVDWRKMNLSDWESMWKANQTPFHRSECNIKLVRYLENIVNGRKELKFFFPLCGKTVDMKWMYDEGHTVIGVETSSKAMEEFFSEHNLKYLVENVAAMDGTVYKSEDSRIRLYCCDLFKFSASIEKDITAIFDRGSMVAINTGDRRQYADLLMSIMAPSARYMLLTYEYDTTKYSGPPHCISLDELRELYGDNCDLELVNVEEALEKEQLRMDALEERVHIITFKA